MVAIDRAGRVVIPKDVRERLLIDEDTDLDLEVVDGEIHLRPRREHSRVVVEVEGWPVLAPVDGQSLTDADVQDARRADQR